MQHYYRRSRLKIQNGKCDCESNWENLIRYTSNQEIWSCFVCSDRMRPLAFRRVFASRSKVSSNIRGLKTDY